MMRYHSCRIAPMLSQVSKFLHIKRFHLSSLSHKERLLLSKNHLIVQIRKLLKESYSYLLLPRQTNNTLDMGQDSKRSQNGRKMGVETPKSLKFKRGHKTYIHYR